MSLSCLVIMHEIYCRIFIQVAFCQPEFEKVPRDLNSREQNSRYNFAFNLPSQPTMILPGMLAMFFLLFLSSQVLLRLPRPLPFYIFLAYVGFTMLIGAAYAIIAHPFFHFIGRHD